MVFDYILYSIAFMFYHHLDRFWFSAIANNVEINLLVYLLVQLFPLDKSPRIVLEKKMKAFFKTSDVYCQIALQKQNSTNQHSQQQ